MSRNDFLYALKEDLPQDFSDELRQKLQQIDDDETIIEIESDKTQEHQQNRWWVLAAASVLVAIIGGFFVINSTPDSDVLNIAELPPTLTNHGDITPETISRLQPITSLGNGFVRRIRVSPDGNTLLVDTTTGIYLHDANDLSAEPIHYPVMQNFQVIDYASDGTIYGVVHEHDYEDENEQTIRIVRFNPATGELTQLFDFMAISADHFEISPDGSRLFVQVCTAETVGDIWCDDNSWMTRIYDTETGVAGAEFASLYNRTYPSYRYLVYAFEFFQAGLLDLNVTAVSEDGSRYIYVTRNAEGDYIINHMNVSTGEVTPILRIADLNESLAIHRINLSHDNQYLLVSGSQTTKAWDLERLLNSDTVINGRTNEPDRMVSLASSGVFYHPTEPVLLSIHDHFISTYDFRDENGYVPPQGAMADTSPHNQLAFSPSGDMLFGLRQSGQIVRYSYPDGNIIDSTFRYDAGSAHLFNFSDNDTLFSTTNQLDGSLMRIWSLDSNQPEQVLFAPDNITPYAIYPELAISPDGRYMVYLGRDSGAGDAGFYWLHNLQTNQRYHITANFGGMNGITMTDDSIIGINGSTAGRLDINVITAEERLYGADTTLLDEEYRQTPFYSSIVAEMSTDGSITAATCSAYNRYAATDCTSTVKIWSLASGQAIYAAPAEPDTYASADEISHDGQILAVATCQAESETVPYPCENAAVRLYDISQLDYETEEIRSLENNLIGTIENLAHPVTQIQFQTDNGIIALSDDSLTTFVQVNADGTSEQLATMPFGGTIAFSPDGNLIFTTNERGQIAIWGVPPDAEAPVSQQPEPLNLHSRDVITADNIADTEIVAEVGNSHAYKIALSPDDETLAIAAGDGIYLHDAHDLNAEPQFIGEPIDYIQYMEYSDDGQLYVFARDMEAIVLYRWSLETNQFVEVYHYTDINPDEYYKAFQMIDLSPDASQLMLISCISSGGYFIGGSPIAFCGDPATARIEIIDLNNPDNTIDILPEETNNVIPAITPDWSQLAYYDSGTIYLYDFSTGETRPVIETNGESNTSYGFSTNPMLLRFTPDGRRLGFLRMSTGKFDSWLVSDLNRVDIQNPFIVRLDDEFVVDSIASQLVFHPITQERIITRSDSIMMYSRDEIASGEFHPIWQAHEMFVSADGDRLYVLNSTGFIQVWDWDTQSLIEQNIEYTNSSEPTLTFSQDSRLLISSNGGYVSSASFVHDIADDAIEARLLLPESEAVMPVDMIAISLDNRYIAYARNLQLYVYDRQDDEHRQLDTYMYPVDMGFRDDGTLVFISVNSGYGDIKLYTPEMLATGDVPYPYDGMHVSEMSFSPTFSASLIPGSNIGMLSSDARSIANFRCGLMIQMMHSDCVVHLEFVDTETGQLIADLLTNLTQQGMYYQMTFSPQGDYFAIAYCADTSDENRWTCDEQQGAVDIWRVADIDEGNVAPLVTVSGLDLNQFSISLLPDADGTFLLSTTSWEEVSENRSEQITRFWSVQADGTPEEVYNMRSSGVTFSPDGRLMVYSNGSNLVFRVVPEE